MKTISNLISDTTKRRLRGDFSQLSDATVLSQVGSGAYRVRLANTGVVVNVSGPPNLSVGNRVVIGSMSSNQGVRRRYVVVSQGVGVSTQDQIVHVGIPNPYA